jgi:hypothetical protein
MIVVRADHIERDEKDMLTLANNIALAEWVVPVFLLMKRSAAFGLSLSMRSAICYAMASPAASPAKMFAASNPKKLRRFM